MKLGTLEISIQRHPLVHYSAIAMCNHGVSRLLYSKGFKRVDKGYNFTYYISRPLSFKSKLEAPIVMFHGLGVGLLSYTPFIMKLCAKYTNTRTIIIFEIAHISTSAQVSARDSLLSVGFVRELMKTLELERLLPRMHILAHSIGTIYAAWILKFAGKEAISSVTLIGVYISLNN
jgi:pimeloyl-ACP methyl ester carboxylesterase